MFKTIFRNPFEIFEIYKNTIIPVPDYTVHNNKWDY